MKNLFLILIPCIFSHNILAFENNDLEDCEGVMELSEVQKLELLSDIQYYKTQCSMSERELGQARLRWWAMCGAGGILLINDMVEEMAHNSALSPIDDTYIPFRHVKLFGRVFWIPIVEYGFKYWRLKYYGGKLKKCETQLQENSMHSL